MGGRRGRRPAARRARRAGPAGHARRVHRPGRRPARRPGRPLRPHPRPVRHRRGGRAARHRGRGRPADPRPGSAASGRVLEGEFRPAGSGRRVVRRRGAAPAAAPFAGPAAAGGRAGRAGSAGPVPAGLAARRRARAGRGGALAARRRRRRSRSSSSWPGARCRRRRWSRWCCRRRVADYSPSMLDELTATGELLWAGHGALPGSDGWVSLHLADTADLTLPDPMRARPVARCTRRCSTRSGGGRGVLLPPAQRHRRHRLRGRCHDAGLDRRPVGAGLVGAGRQRHPRAAAGDGRRSGRRGPRGAPLPAHAAARPRAPGPVDRPRRLPTRGGPPRDRRALVRCCPRSSPTPPGARTPSPRGCSSGTAWSPGARWSASACRAGSPAVYKVLAAFEETGRCRRGYFVDGLGAAQFGGTGAVDRLRALAGEERATRREAGGGHPRRDRPGQPLRRARSPLARGRVRRRPESHREGGTPPRAQGRCAGRAGRRPARGLRRARRRARCSPSRRPAGRRGRTTPPTRPTCSGRRSPTSPPPCAAARSAGSPSSGPTVSRSSAATGAAPRCAGRWRPPASWPRRAGCGCAGRRVSCRARGRHRLAHRAAPCDRALSGDRSRVDFRVPELAEHDLPGTVLDHAHPRQAPADPVRHRRHPAHAPEDGGVVAPLPTPVSAGGARRTRRGSCSTRPRSGPRSASPSAWSSCSAPTPRTTSSATSAPTCSVPAGTRPAEAVRRLADAARAAARRGAARPAQPGRRRQHVRRRAVLPASVATRSRRCATSDLARLVDRAHRVLFANRERVEQTTTGDLRRDRRLWVYRRERQPVPALRHPDPDRPARSRGQDRASYWCRGASWAAGVLSRRRPRTRRSSARSRTSAGAHRFSPDRPTPG